MHIMYKLWFKSYNIQRFIQEAFNNSITPDLLRPKASHLSVEGLEFAVSPEHIMFPPVKQDFHSEELKQKRAKFLNHNPSFREFNVTFDI